MNKTIIILICIILGVAIVYSALLTNRSEEPGIWDSLIYLDINIPDKYTEPLKIVLENNPLLIEPVNAMESSVIKESDNVFKYIDAYINTDVVQTIKTHKLKEDIILKKPGHPDKFEYMINLDKYEHGIDRDGNLHIYPKARKDEIAKLFVLPAPFMIDANGEKSYEVEMYFQDGILTLIPDKEWLASHEYPIILDPTIEIQVINTQSFPQIGGEWEIKFGTNGQGKLDIIPMDEATEQALEFVSLYCWKTKVHAQIHSNNGITVRGWSCDGEASLIYKIINDGKHSLRFEFSDSETTEISYAYNSTKSDYEFLIKLEDTVSDRKGDCIVFKQSGWDWGYMERQNFGLVRIKNLSYEEAESLCNDYSEGEYNAEARLKDYVSKKYFFDIQDISSTKAENRDKQPVEINKDKVKLRP